VFTIIWHVFTTSRIISIALQSCLQSRNSGIMRFLIPTLLAALTMEGTTSAIALPATVEQTQIPDLPEGFFAGYNNPDETSTLHFLDTNENITFTPLPGPHSTGLEKRITQFGCWDGTLDRSGLDSAMNQMRSRLSQLPIGVGQWSDWPPYFGYNANGVYAYACENSGVQGAYYFFRDTYLSDFSYRMDQRCGAYVPGYIQESVWDNPTVFLFGRAKSGTAVCQGNSRSPR